MLGLGQVLLRRGKQIFSAGESLSGRQQDRAPKSPMTARPKPPALPRWASTLLTNSEAFALLICKNAPSRGFPNLLSRSVFWTGIFGSRAAHGAHARQQSTTQTARRHRLGATGDGRVQPVPSHPARQADATVPPSPGCARRRPPASLSVSDPV
jgi:hypothetical protein